MSNYRIFIKDNYLQVVDIATNELFQAPAAKVSVTRKKADSTEFLFEGIVLPTAAQVAGIEYEDTFDEAGDAYADLETLADFYTANTGKSNAGAAAGDLDSTPTSGSTNGVESGGVYTELQSKENSANKSNSIATDQGSTTKFPSVKAVFDWCTNTFTTTSAVAAQITAALSGYATQSYVNSQGFITNVVSALGYTPRRKTTAATGTVVAFNAPLIYNTIASPGSGNITYDLTGAEIGNIQKMYHNAGTEPTYPVGSVKRGNGSYVPSTLNVIYFEWSVGTTVEYWITQ